MKKNRDVDGEPRILEKTLDSLGERREAPIGVFVLLLILYLVTTVTVSLTAGSQAVVVFGGKSVPLYIFAGTLASVANLCIVLMVVFCGKAGFITSVIVLLIQCPMLLAGIFIRGNITSIPGVFGNILTIIAIIMIYLGGKKVAAYQLRLREQATTDILTGLPNGFAGTELLIELIKRGTPFAAVTINLNSFKIVNDTMGFDMGNKVLIEVASRWKKIADTGVSGTLDFISRINGDEYSLIVRDFHSEEDIVKTIRLYEAALNDKISIDGYEFVVDASFGYAVFPVDATDLDTLISDSVAAMKEIKRIKSSEHMMRFTPDLLKTQISILIDNTVRDALEQDRVIFYLQPQYDVSHKLRGFEALARIRNADGSIMNPDEFIHAAERIGLIDSIDLMVYRKSAAFFGELIKRTGTGITLSINASVKHMMKTGFADEIRNLLADSGIPAGQLEVEITESIMIESAEKAAECLTELKDMGVRIAIDDFGTGYSSLSYLNSFPSDILKIDKSFIDQMNTGDSSKKYVEAIISLAHVMEFEVIAEGVEEASQLETLRNIHCDYIQGFLWGHPLPQEEAEKLVVAG